MTKILYIENEVAILEEVLDWLNYQGYEAIGAINGRIGIEKALQEKPDLILCDIAMPQMDGYSVLLEIRSNRSMATTPFIFLTASADYSTMRRGMDLGADDYLTKPFDHPTLITAIQARLEKKASLTRQAQSEIDMLTDLFNQEHEQRVLKSRLVAMFSHDFRDQLAAILSSNTLMQNYHDRLTPERRQVHLNRVEGSVRQLMQTLDDMIIIAQMEAGTFTFMPQPTEIEAFVQGIVDEFRLIDSETHIINFESDYQGRVGIDTRLLRQILSNLLANAIRYSPSGTHIDAHLAKSGNEIVVSVRDYGIGIPQTHLDTILNPIQQVSSTGGTVSGIGLGLAIVKQAVEMHQGVIRVESKVGEGTTFIVRLPISDQSRPMFQTNLEA